MAQPPSGPPRQGVPTLLVDAAGWCWRILVIAAAVTLLGMLALRLELVTIPLFAALLFTALLWPLVRRLRRLGLNRGVAALTAVLLAVVALGGVGTYVVDRAVAEYPDLVDQVSRLVEKTQHYLETGPLHVQPTQINNIGDQFVHFLQARQGEIANGVVTAGRTIAEVLTAVVLCFFLTIFLLYDGERIWGWIAGLFPRRARARVDIVGSRMWETVSGYVTGTFLVALFHGLVMGVTLAIVGVPLVAPLTLLIFIGSFIPLIGAVVFGGLAVLVTLVTNGVAAAVIVLVVLVVENQAEGHLLQPFVVGRHVRLHPMAIALTLAAGAVVAGLPGAIFGVPLVAAVNAAAKALRETEPGGPADPAAAAAPRAGPPPLTAAPTVTGPTVTGPAVTPGPAVAPDAGPDG